MMRRGLSVTAMVVLTGAACLGQQAGQWGGVAPRAPNAPDRVASGMDPARAMSPPHGIPAVKDPRKE